VLMAKTIKSYIRKTVFPNEVKSIRYNGKMVSETVVRSIVMYFTIIFLIMGLSVLVVSAEQGISIETAVSTVATSLNNNGIELSAASLCEFWNYHWWTKLTYIIDMLIGRLEIFPVMALFIYLFKPVENLGKRMKRKANY
jgi:trk system potassium uptake protein